MVEVQEKLKIFEESFELITESIDEPLFIINQDYLVEYVNCLPLLKQLGYSNDELQGNSLLDYIFEEDLEVATYTLKNCPVNKTDTTRLRFKHKLGTVKNYEFYAQKTITYNRTVKFLIILKDFSDIFEHEKRKQKLKASKELYQDLYENVPNAYFSFGSDKSIRRFNKVAENLLGYSKDELLQMKVLDLYAKNDNGTSKAKRLFKEFLKGKIIQDEELQMQKKNGGLVWISLTVNPILDQKGNIIESRSMVVNISKRKKVEQELKKLEGRLKYVTSLGLTIIYTAKASGDYGRTFVSENVKNLIGYFPEDFVKNSEFWIKYIYPEDRDFVTSKLSNISKKKNIGVEYRFKFKDGTYHWIRDESILITDEEGDPVELIGSWTDITWIKKSEEKLRYQAKLVENVSDAIISTDLYFNIITWNKAAEFIYGWKAEEVIRKNLSEIIPLTYPGGNAEASMNNLFEEGFWKGEIIQPHKDGTPIDILSSVSLIIDDKENHIGIVATNRDITEKKKTEDKIRESEKRLQDLIEAVPVGISITTPEGKVIECNSQAFKVFGLNSKEDFLEIPVLNRYKDPRERERFIELHEQELVKDFEAKFKRIDGSVFWGTITSIKQEIEDQIVYINSFQDITERKEKEEELRLHSKIMTNMSEGIYLVRLEDLVIVYANPIFEEMFGYDPGEMIGKYIEIIKTPADKTPKDTKEEIVEILKDKGEWHGEMLNIKKDGTLFWCYANVSVFDHPEYGRVIISVHTDITERKKAEKALIESEERFRSTFELAAVGIAHTAIDGSFLKVNQALCDIVKYSYEELLNLTFQDITYQEDLDEDLQYVSQVLDNKIQTFSIEKRYVCKDNSIVWVKLTGSLVREPSGKPKYFIAIIEDINEKKISEQKLKDSEKQYRDLSKEMEMIFDHLPGVIAYKDTKNNLLRVNKFMADAHNLKKEDMEGKNAFDFYPFEEAQAYWEDDLEVVVNKKPKLNIIEPWETLEGRRWVNTSKIPYIDEDGSVKGIIALVFDITDRINAEQGLKESEEKYRSLSNQYKMLLESITDAVYALNREWEYIIVNKNAEKITNMPVENLLGQKIFDVFPSIEETSFFKTYENVMNSRKATRVAELFTYPDGHKGYYEVSVYPINEGILCIAKDITEEKEIERKLKASEERYRNLFENSPIALFEQDFSELKSYLNTLKDSGIVDFEKYFNENPEEILNCSSMIKIIDVNKNALEIYKANSMEEFVKRKNKIEKSLLRDVSPELLLVNKQELLSFINGDTTFESETVNKTLTGNNIYLYMKTLIIPGFEKTWSKVIVSFLDITNRKIIEQKLRESEEKFRMLFNNANDTIFIVDLEGNIIECNQTAYERLGYTKDELLQMTPSDLDTEKYAVKVSERISTTQQLGKLFFEVEHKRKDGSIIPVEINSKMINFNGKSAILSIARDITERKKAEEKLKESEEKFRTIAEQSSIGVTIQQGGYIRFANKAVSEIVEYPTEEINNQPVESLYSMIYKEDLPLMIESFKERQLGDFKSEKQLDLRVLSKLGKVKWVSIFTKPIIYLGKNALLSTLIDITDKKQVEEELKEVSRLKSDLISRTSHELKTPLVSIKGYADLLLSQHYNELDFYTISVLHEMKQGCSRLESLIKDLLETSKLESGEIKLNKSKEDLAFLIRYSIKDLQGLIENRKHELKVEIQDKMVTLFEKEKIYEVIINLLSNSIKYTPSNGTININSEIRDDMFMISIKDDGIGLTESEKLKIFKKFGKVERYGKGLDVISEGTGLGLYISKKIIELHGGMIWVESKGRNKGSTFYFSLPIIKN